MGAPAPILPLRPNRIINARLEEGRLKYTRKDRFEGAGKIHMTAWYFRNDKTPGESSGCSLKWWTYELDAGFQLQDVMGPEKKPRKRCF